MCKVNILPRLSWTDRDASKRGIQGAAREALHERQFAGDHEREPEVH